MGSIDELTARVPQSVGETTRTFRFHGSGGTLWGIGVVTLLLSLCTLGLYYPWGKVKARKYLYGQTEFDGDRFAFHGTGKELLLGWIKVAIILGAMAGLAIAIMAFVDGSLGEVGSKLAVSAVSWLLAPVAIIGAQRYRLSRSSWRGIRFTFRGRLREFFPKFIAGSLLVPLTLGLYTPLFQNAMRQYLVDHSYFGTRSFRYHGRARDLLPRFLVAIPLMALTLGAYWFWYKAFRDRYFWDHTEIAGARFVCTVKGLDLLWLALTNALLLALTLGVAFPWVRVRNLRYRLSHLALVGAVDLAGILQEARDASAMGEEMSDFVGDTLLDIELGL